MKWITKDLPFGGTPENGLNTYGQRGQMKKEKEGKGRSDNLKRTDKPMPKGDVQVSEPRTKHPKMWKERTRSVCHADVEE